MGALKVVKVLFGSVAFPTKKHQTPSLLTGFDVWKNKID
jgi:hypothetical protein